MQNVQSQNVIKRFYDAIYALQTIKKIRGKKTFTVNYGINRWNFNSMEEDMSRDIFQVAWLTFIVSDFGVNADWLLTGRGDIFSNIKDQREYDDMEGQMAYNYIYKNR